LLILLIGSIALNALFRFLLATKPIAIARFWLTLGVAANLGLLGFFKYSGLLFLTFLGEHAGSERSQFVLSIPLPIGISFFTFQGISLLVDTLRARSDDHLRGLLAENKSQHWIDTTLFIAFFPQLVAGPIVKAHDFMPQINQKMVSEIDWAFAYRTLVIGYFLKMVVADNLKMFTMWIEYPVFLTKSTLTLLALLFGFSMQIFADFAGYSLIAISVSAIFGYRLSENFRFPYISCSFSEFWRRWHISLSSFLKEYLYIPLGGNRSGRLRTYFNLIVTMSLGGLWHGAAWSYAFWGLAHGVALVLERAFANVIPIEGKRSWKILGTMIVFSYVTFAWLLFKLPNFDHVLQFFGAMSTNLSLPNEIGLMAKVFVYSMPVIVYHLWHLARERVQNEAGQHLESFAFGAMLFLIVTNSGPTADFIYFQF